MGGDVGAGGSEPGLGDGEGLDLAEGLTTGDEQRGDEHENRRGALSPSALPLSRRCDALVGFRAASRRAEDAVGEEDADMVVSTRRSEEVGIAS